METKNKYYTPTIEEFHVGFEYEVKYTNGTLSSDWIKERIEQAPEVVSLPYMNLKNIRVKYLDKEDIESLGWEHTEDRGMSENYGWQFQKPIEYLSGGIAYYRLRYWYRNHRLRIEPLGGPIFDGTIKNKSELIKLLQQLGIRTKGNKE